jgi:4,5-DOPA dioxygenase extradiol
VVHNLGLVDLAAGEMAFDWAVRFDEACTAAMLEEPERTGSLAGHPDYRRAVPTPDHFLPLAPIAGLAAASGSPARTLVEGYVGGSLSMTGFRVD